MGLQRGGGGRAHSRSGPIRQNGRAGRKARPRRSHCRRLRSQRAPRSRGACRARRRGAHKPSAVGWCRSGRAPVGWISNGMCEIDDDETVRPCRLRCRRRQGCDPVACDAADDK
eukprot:1259503-Prymnesium_polylepis.1